MIIINWESFSIGYMAGIIVLQIIQIIGRRFIK